MEKPVKLNTKFATAFLQEEKVAALDSLVLQAHNKLVDKNGEGSEFLGWLALPDTYKSEEFSRIVETAQKIRQTCDILLVVGIGGSYLGPRAGIEFLNGVYHNYSQKPQVFFVGNNISGSYFKEILHFCEDKEVAVNVISKSGTTTEPAIAFRFIKEYLEKRYGKEKAKSRIFATTDKSKGTLKELADKEGYQTFIIPDDCGGRFSVLSPVGLLPLAVSGVDIGQVLLGARQAMNDFSSCDSENDCYHYAKLRNYFYSQGKQIELFASYEPDNKEFTEWLKQLFGESEGKQGKGLFPASVTFSTDLHSLGQFVQEGSPILFETVLDVKKPKNDILIEKTKDNFDKLNYLAGKTFSQVNKKAMEGTILAHTQGGVPNLVLEIEDYSPYTFGYLVYFFEKACAISGYMLGVNPFDQPGVEMYKTNMFALLGKEGFEEKQKELLAQMN